MLGTKVTYSVGTYSVHCSSPDPLFSPSPPLLPETKPPTILLASGEMEKNTETVLIIGATGNIGIAAILGALGSDRNVLAVVRDQHSMKKVLEHVPTGHDRITIVEADAVSDQGVQNIVDQVRTGSLPAFQHVFACGM